MRIAIEAAKFSENDADGLRRSMATFRHLGSVGEYETKFLEGMKGRGYDMKMFNEMIKLRKMDADERAEREALRDLYGSALGIFG